MRWAALVLALALAPAASAAGPRLDGAHACPDAPGFTARRSSCRSTTPARVAGTLRLQVAAATNADAPRGVLLFLTGGPGPAGRAVRAADRRSGSARCCDGYRLVVLDQRGTGARRARLPGAAAARWARPT